MNKKYFCCICHKEIQRNIRLVKQKWGNSRYGFGNIANYDFCNRCYEIFERWLNKHKEK